MAIDYRTAQATIDGMISNADAARSMIDAGDAFNAANPLFIIADQCIPAANASPSFPAAQMLGDAQSVFNLAAMHAVMGRDVDGPLKRGTRMLKDARALNREHHEKHAA